MLPKKTQCHLDVLRVIEGDFVRHPISPPLLVIDETTVSALPNGAFARIQARKPSTVTLGPNEVAIAYHLWAGYVPAIPGSDIPFVWEEPNHCLVFRPSSTLYMPDTREVDYDEVPQRLVFHEGRLAFCISKNGNHRTQVNVRYVTTALLDGPYSLTTKVTHERNVADCSSPTLPNLRYAVPKPQSFSTPTKLKTTTTTPPITADTGYTQAPLVPFPTAPLFGTSQPHAPTPSGPFFPSPSCGPVASSSNANSTNPVISCGPSTVGPTNIPSPIVTLVPPPGGSANAYGTQLINQRLASLETQVSELTSQVSQLILLLTRNAPSR